MPQSQRQAQAQGPAQHQHQRSRRIPPPLYTAAERLRRDRTRWTLVQGVLAPLQFLVFGLSLILVLRFLLTGADEQAAAISVVIKTLLLYTIMVTGAAWEKAVFGRWLFAPAFFWEDVVSMGVIALHTLYLGLRFGALASVRVQFAVALLGYAGYVVNATQFLLKLRAARLGAKASCHDGLPGVVA